jgi:hypothetical protein
MKTLTTLFAVLFAIIFVAASTSQVFGQEKVASPSVATSPVAAPPAAGQPNMEEMMKQMTELMKLNENHKFLADSAGTWNYTVKMWMGDPSAKPAESKGTAVRKMVMNGRYLVGDYTSSMKMPGPDGKMKDVTFKGMGTEAYDNVKKKFLATWMDNMGTGIMMMEGEYDPATKSLTSAGDEEAMPGMKMHIRSVTKFPDKDHMTLEWYESQPGGPERKTMEINYTRAGATKAK